MAFFLHLFLYFLPTLLSVLLGYFTVDFFPVECVEKNSIDLGYPLNQPVEVPKLSMGKKCCLVIVVFIGVSAGWSIGEFLFE